MQQHPSAAERVYTELKARLFEGAISPGRIDIQRLAERLNLSQTPVREALARLAAEHLLEFTPRIGYATPNITTDALRDLYAWSGQLLHLALGGVVQPRDLSTDDPKIKYWRALRHTNEGQYAGDAAVLFFEIALSQPNAELVDKVAQSNDRLFLARSCEPSVLLRAADELREIIAVWRAPDFVLLAASIDAYHAARIACASEIARCAAARRSAQPFP